MAMLTQRSSSILGAVVERYIESCAPVSAQAISQRRFLNLSPASVRSVMADLEAQGFLSQPHPSAGRTPSDKGFRYYVDSLVQQVSLTQEEQATIAALTSGAEWCELADLLADISSTLAHFSDQVALVGLVSLGAPVRKIHFVHISDRQVMAVIVTTGGAVQNRLITTSQSLTQDMLNRVANFLNDRFSGRTLFQIRQTLAEEAMVEKNRVDLLVQWAMQMSDAMDRDAEETGGLVVVNGTANLLGSALPEQETASIKGVLETLSKKQKLFCLIDELLKSGGATTLIGAETGVDELNDFSVVAHCFMGGDGVLGAVGIIGPKPMNYGRIGALVSSAAVGISARFAQ